MRKEIQTIAAGIAVFCGLLLPALASAAITTASGAVNGSASATVASGGSVSVSATVSMTAASNEWHGTSYAIGTVLPDAWLCADTPDHSGIGTSTESFSAQAPSAAGTYNLYLQAKSTNACGGSTVGTVLVLPNAVVVQAGGGTVPPAATSTPPAAVVLQVTGIDELQPFATADNTFAHGFRWMFHVTVPDGETALGMKFSDFVSGSKVIPAAGNFRFYSAQSDDAADAARAIIDPSADAYGDEMNLVADLSPGTPGRQIEIAVEAKVPPGTKSGNYSTSYGIRSLLPVIEAHFVQP